MMKILIKEPWNSLFQSFLKWNFWCFPPKLKDNIFEWRYQWFKTEVISLYAYPCKKKDGFIDDQDLITEMMLPKVSLKRIFSHFPTLEILRWVEILRILHYRRID